MPGLTVISPPPPGLKSSADAMCNVANDSQRAAIALKIRCERLRHKQCEFIILEVHRKLMRSHDSKLRCRVMAKDGCFR